MFLHRPDADDHEIRNREKIKYLVRKATKYMDSDPQSIGQGEKIQGPRVVALPLCEKTRQRKESSIE